MERHKGLGRRTTFISCLTLLSRVLGLGREMVAAYLFGHGSGIFDAFLSAWRIPNLLRRLLGEGALSTSLQTELTRADSEGGPAEGASLFQGTMRLVFAILLFVCGAGMVIAWCLPDTMPVTGAEWLGEDPAALRELLWRLMPFVVFICLTALAAGALQVRGHYAMPAWAPVVLNLGWIAALLVIGLAWGFDKSDSRPEGEEMEMVRALAWGVLAAGAAQLALQLPALKRTGLLTRAAGGLASGAAGARRVLVVGVPLAFGAAVYQVNVLVDGWMAEALLPNGDVTLHYYANRLQQLPLALCSVAAVTAVFPALLLLGQKGDNKGLRRLHDETQRMALTLLVPAAAGLWVLAAPVISALLQRGAFGAEGVERAAPALKWLALALVPAGSSLLAVRVYYAKGDYWTPVRCSLVSIGLNTGLNVLFLVKMGMNVDGLALGTALSSWVHLGLLLRGHGRLGLPSALKGTGILSLQLLLAALLMGWAASSVEDFLREEWGRVGALSAAIGVGVLLFLCAAKVLRISTLDRLLERLKRRSGA